MRYLVLTIKNNVPHDLLLMTDDRQKAEATFIVECSKSQGTIDDESRNHFLEEGFCETADGSVTYLDLSCTPGFPEPPPSGKDPAHGYYPDV